MITNEYPIYIRKSHRWVSEMIGNQYQMWSERSNQQRLIDANVPPDKNLPVYLLTPPRIFIDSPTGTGKTSFILKDLLTYAKNRGETILYICNRRATWEQIYVDLVAHQPFSFLQNTVPSMNPKARKPSVFDFPGIHVITYQSANALLKRWGLFDAAQENSGKAESPQNKLQKPTPIPYYQYMHHFTYVVFDEAHFFLEDSAFNTGTYHTMVRLLETFNRSVHIYMSATLGEARDILLPILYQSSQKYAADDLHPISVFTINYTNTYRAADYDIRFFLKGEEIEQKILELRKSGSDDKWLIFVNSIDEGKTLKARLKANIGVKVQFVYAGSRNNALKKIANDGMFTQDVLIATKVLDSGVNIHDPRLKHIVLPFCEPTDLVQMLGRKRADEGEVVHVYAKCPDIRRLKYLYRETATQYNRMKRIDADETEKSHAYVTNLMNHYWQNPNPNFNKHFYIDKDRRLRCNPLFFKKLELSYGFYAYLLAAPSPEFVYARRALENLGLDSTQPLKFLSADVASSLVELLERYVDVEIAPSDWDRFYTGFNLAYEEHCRAKYGDDPIYRKGSVRPRTDAKKATVNERLKFLGLPYKLIKRNNSWVLVKTDGASPQPTGQSPENRL